MSVSEEPRVSRYRSKRSDRVTKQNNLDKYKVDCSHATFIFKVYRNWLVPNYLIRNEVEEKVLGRPSSGDLKLDRQIERDVVTISATLSQIAPMFIEGHRAGPCSEDIGCEAFYHLTGHLIDWCNYIKHPSLFSGSRPIPIEGLREINNLAKAVHSIAIRDGYATKLTTRKSAWAALTGKGGRDDGRLQYNSSMIDFIEREYRKRRHNFKNNRGLHEFRTRGF